MTAAQVLSVHRASHDDDLTCRRCGQPIERGRRYALVTGIGNVHIRCIINGAQDSETSGDKRQ